MKLKYKYSYIYHKNLNRHNPVDLDWEKIKEHGEKFVSKHKNTIEEIVDMIPNVTNREWGEDKLDVYIVGWKGPSFSKPLTLKVNKDMLLMLTILTHELLHNNVENKKPGLELENEINNYVEKIFKELKINIEEQIKQMRELSKKNQT